MGFKRHSNSVKQSKSDSEPVSLPSEASDHLVPCSKFEVSAAYRRIIELISQGKFEQAYQHLNAKNEGRESEHVKAVCLLRLGRYSEAFGILRGLVKSPGCTWMRAEAPLVYKTNFATALLLGGHPGGCKSILAEINNEHHASVIRLRTAIGKRERTLNVWQRFNWRWCSIDPENRPVTIDFEPGDFFEPAGRPSAPLPAAPGSNLKTAG